MFKKRLLAFAVSSNSNFKSYSHRKKIILLCGANL